MSRINYNIQEINGTNKILLERNDNLMKVLLINGSPRANGNTALALKEMEKIFAQVVLPVPLEPVKR